MRVPPRDLDFQVLEMVSLAAPTEQSCMCNVAKEQHHLSKAPLIQEKTNSQFLRCVCAHGRVSPFHSA